LKFLLVSVIFGIYPTVTFFTLYIPLLHLPLPFPSHGSCILLSQEGKELSCEERFLLILRSKFVLIIVLGFISTASMNGHVGVVHFIENISDVEWIIQEGKHHPYIALFRSDQFDL